MESGDWNIRGFTVSGNSKFCCAVLCHTCTLQITFWPLYTYYGNCDLIGCCSHQTSVIKCFVTICINPLERVYTVHILLSSFVM